MTQWQLQYANFQGYGVTSFDIDADNWLKSKNEQSWETSYGTAAEKQTWIENWDK